MRSSLAGAMVALFVLSLMPVAFAQGNVANEKQKIEALIKHVENLKSAKFIRNGKEYDAKNAAKFLRGKWKANDAKIKTATDFVEKAASLSSTTGKPYEIQFQDGTRVKSGDYLLAELKKLEKPPGDKRGP